MKVKPSYILSENCEIRFWASFLQLQWREHLRRSNKNKTFSAAWQLKETTSRMGQMRVDTWWHVKSCELCVSLCVQITAGQIHQISWTLTHFTSIMIPVTCQRGGSTEKLCVSLYWLKVELKVQVTEVSDLIEVLQHSHLIGCVYSQVLHKVLRLQFYFMI